MIILLNYTLHIYSKNNLYYDNKSSVMFMTFVMFYQFISNNLIFIQTKLFCIC